RLLTALVAALALIPAAHAASTLPTSPVGTEKPPKLSEARVIKVFLADPKVAKWLKRYPPDPTTDATFTDGSWTVSVWSGKAGEIATGKVEDPFGFVTESWVGPQVAWTMARGVKGAFGGDRINSIPIWLGFCGLFLLGLVDWRRPFSLRTLDLLMLLSFSVPLWFFNHGNVFAAVPLFYPGLLWLLARCLWIGARDRSPRGTPVWPIW